MTDLKTLASIVASNKLVSDLFGALANNKSMQLNHLVGWIRDKYNQDVSDKDVRDALYTLQKIELIKEMPSTIDAFNTYYITADGLNAEKQLGSLR